MIDLTLLISTLTSVNTGIYMWMLARGDGRGWYLSLFAQVLWALLIWQTAAYGLIPLSTWLLFVAIKGLRRHRGGE